MKIGIVGSGNVASHLTRALIKAGYSIAGVCSRKLSHAEALIEEMDSLTQTTIATDRIENLLPTDILILAINDDSIQDIAQALGKIAPKSCVFHTSGSTSLKVLSEYLPHCGVLYPLQTFSKDRKVDFSSVPLFIEASDGPTQELLRSIALSLSKRVIEMDSEQRKRMHLAAVFACNFVNHCYVLAEQEMNKCGLDFEILLPLIDETTSKVHTLSPRQAQTGPAVRNDKRIINLQKSLLGQSEQDIYQLLSDNIQRIRYDKLRPHKN